MFDGSPPKPDNGLKFLHILMSLLFFSFLTSQGHNSSPKFIFYIHDWIMILKCLLLIF